MPITDTLAFGIRPAVAFDVSDDGRRILIAKGSRPPLALTRLHVVLNWVEEVRSKVFPAR
jgi:hypothetical protein